MRRRIARLMIGPGAFAVALVAVGPGMVAQPASASAAAFFAYGPTGRGLTVDHSVVSRGATITLHATGFVFPESFTIRSANKVIGHAVTSRSGRIVASVVIPANSSTGPGTVTLTGSKGEVASAAVYVDATPIAAVLPRPAPSSFTGTDAAGVIGGGAALVGLGGLLILRSRRRRTAWSS